MVAVCSSFSESGNVCHIAKLRILLLAVNGWRCLLSACRIAFPPIACLPCHPSLPINPGAASGSRCSLAPLPFLALQLPHLLTPPPSVQPASLQRSLWIKEVQPALVPLIRGSAADTTALDNVRSVWMCDQGLQPLSTM